MIEISKRITILSIFFVLALCKILGVNGLIDDCMLLAIGAIIGKEVIANGKEKIQGEARSS